MSEEDSLQKECDERNEQTGAYIDSHYGPDSYGPRRSYHWEVQGNQLCLVEE